jgi:hypothetical protein
MLDRWIWAMVAIGAGLVVGTVVGWLVRNRLQQASSRPVVRRVANASGAFLFWFFTVVGSVFAIGLVSPETLRPIPRQVLDYLPRVLSAGLIVIGGWALAIVASSVLAAALSRATGRLEREFELVIRYTIVSLVGVLALAQLGVDVTIITVLVAVVALTCGASVAVLIGHGGRQVSAEIAAGRYLRSFIDVGDRLTAGEFDGTVLALHPATVELERADGTRFHAPYSRVLDTGPTIRSQREG